MTTVIYHRTHGLFADDRLTDGLFVLPPCRKIYSLGSGVYAALLGSAAVATQVLDAMRHHLAGGAMVADGETLEQLNTWIAPCRGVVEAYARGTPEDDQDHGVAIVVDMCAPDIVLQLSTRPACTLFFELSRRDPFITWGSGGAYAAGALQCGASPEAAIRAVAKHDLGTGPTGHFVAPWTSDTSNPIRRFK